MPDTNISLVDEPLTTLLQAGEDFPKSDLDFSVAYISTMGVNWLQNLLKNANSARVIAGLCAINHVNTFVLLKKLGVEVYVYCTEPGKIFHPKIYYGRNKEQAWAMIGSSNLTDKGLSLNVERNLFIAGKRLTEPFTSIESHLEAFRAQAYPFDEEIKKKLSEIEIRRVGTSISETNYVEKLIKIGIKPIVLPSSTIPTELQDVALETVFDYSRKTRLVYAYQMLLLLIMLNRTRNGLLSIEEAANCFSEFYRLRVKEGYKMEEDRGTRHADLVIGNIKQISKTILIDPFPRFQNRGLLDLSEDAQYLSVSPALLAALTPSDRDELRLIAIRRLAKHFKQDESTIEMLVTTSIG